MGEQPTLTVIVAQRQLLCDNVLLLELENALDGQLPSFGAGSHIDIHLPGGHVRQYSLCNDPADPHRYRIAIRRVEDGRGGSVAAHCLAIGDRLTIGTPRNSFPLVENASRSILIAAGIGITPLVAMAHRLRVLDRPYALHFRSNRARLDMVKTLAQGIPPDRLCIDIGKDRANFGFAARIGAYEDNAHLYICGPHGFVEAARTAATGWPADAVHSESFSPITPVEGDRTFEVQTASDGAWHVVPASKTILQVLVDAGYAIPSSCEQGICGSCRTGVLDGIPDHRDLCLTVADHQSNAFITPCCSRSVTERLVLNL